LLLADRAHGESSRNKMQQQLQQEPSKHIQGSWILKLCIEIRVYATSAAIHAGEFESLSCEVVSQPALALARGLSTYGVKKREVCDDEAGEVRGCLMPAS